MNITADEDSLIEKLQMLLERHIKEIEIKNKIVADTEAKFYRYSHSNHDYFTLAEYWVHDSV